MSKTGGLFITLVRLVRFIGSLVLNLLLFSFRALILNLLIEIVFALIIPPRVSFCSSKNCFIDFCRFVAMFLGCTEGESG